MLFEKLRSRFGITNNVNELRSLEKKKGIAQLISSIENIAQNCISQIPQPLQKILASKKNIVPVLLVQDTSLNIPILNRVVYLALHVYIESLEDPHSYFCPFVLLLSDLFLLIEHPEHFESTLLSYANYVRKEGFLTFYDYAMEKLVSPTQVDKVMFDKLVEEAKQVLT